MNKVEINGIERKRPNFIIWLGISTGNGGSCGGVRVNPRGLTVLMKYFRVQKPSELKGKTFESKEYGPTKALDAFFKYNYPGEKGIIVTDFHQKSGKYDPYIWTIDRVCPPAKYLIIGPNEEEYRVINLLGNKEGCSWNISGPAYLRPKAQQLLMDYFHVSKLEELVGKNFRANVLHPDIAVYTLLAKIVDPDLV